jgi:hypothetical protein
LTHCQQQRDALRAQLPETVTDQLAKLEDRIQTKCAEWQNLLMQDVEQGRRVLRALLVEPFRFTPMLDGRRRGYTFTATIALDRLVSGVVDLPVTGPEGGDSSSPRVQRPPVEITENTG